MAQKAQIQCPYCEEGKEPRGLYAHVMNSSDEIHGEHGTVPEDFEEKRKNLYDQKGEQNELYFCHHCASYLEGYKEFSQHLSKKANDSNHPADATPQDGDFTIIPADENWEPEVDESELMQLEGEVINQMHDLSMLGKSNLERTPISESELRDKISQAVIPYNVRKVEQVAALLNQVPELYDRPQVVQGAIDCSQTSFYEGRKLYDNGIEVGEVVNVTSSSDGPKSGFKVEEHEDGYKVDDEIMVPLSEVVDVAKFVSEASNRSAKLVAKYRE